MLPARLEEKYFCNSAPSPVTSIGRVVKKKKNFDTQRPPPWEYINPVDQLEDRELTFDSNTVFADRPCNFSTIALLSPGRLLTKLCEPCLRYSVKNFFQRPPTSRLLIHTRIYRAQISTDTFHVSFSLLVKPKRGILLLAYLHIYIFEIGCLTDAGG